MPRKRSTSKKVGRGNGHVHSANAARQAQHVMRSERKRGMSPTRSKQIAWATVHKDMPRKKREAKERGRRT